MLLRTPVCGELCCYVRPYLASYAVTYARIWRVMLLRTPYVVSNVVTYLRIWRVMLLRTLVCGELCCNVPPYVTSYAATYACLVSYVRLSLANYALTYVYI